VTAAAAAAATTTVSRGALRRVLLALASRLPAVGYCQGLNWVAAHLLRWLAEPDALCLLSLLVARLLPQGVYTDLSGAAGELVCGGVLAGTWERPALPS